MTTIPSKSDESRRAQYEVWRAFLSGAQAAQRPLPGQSNKTYNYARTLVRKGASYVFPAEVAFHVVDHQNQPDANNDTEALLSRLYAELDLHEFDIAQEEERSTIGDAAEKITWDATRNLPRVISVDPASLTATWSPDNPTVAHRIRQEYEAPGWALEPYGIKLSDPNLIVRVIEEWSDTEWTLTVPSAMHSKSQPNPFGWIPYLVLPNRPEPRSFWGTSDLIDLVDAARDFNKALQTLGTIIDYSGAPIAVLENVDDTDNIRVKPGAKWELPEGAKTYLLDLLAEGGLDQHNKYIDQLRTTMHDLSETPRTSFGDTGRALSGAALEIEVHPMVQKTKRKRAGWSRHYTERNRRLLDLWNKHSGQPVAGDTTTTTVWPPILPTDDDALVRQQVQLVGQGIRSRYTANKALGVTDPENELRRVAEESATENTHATNSNTQSGNGLREVRSDEGRSREDS